ncbi:hypothetical protein DYD21_00700 [Rhodohalobacter sp. SW132]|uniref:BF3164 family lipoprotein n=1 Tax=Rhodohalobacter sp. SW132 TaxID=2293433 RepID=UPI000E22CF50|nr:BF3164 family lipoprotein [Rhodohalobacter sp. SW132]REL38500.1 hypothetical protein DYD21_00700 [Rhodohalobacter sp. SW132]
MVHKVTLSFFLILILLISCAEENREETFFDTSHEYLTPVVQHEMSFEEIHQPRKMRVIDGRLFVSDFSNRPAFHELSAETDGELTYTRGLGTEGDGPGEFLMIEDFADAGSLIYIYDGQQLKLTGFENDFNPEPVDEIYLETGGHPLAVYHLSNGSFVSSGLYADERIQVFDDEGAIKRRIGDLTSFDDSFSGRELAISWYSFSAISPDEDWIALFSSNSDHIETYDLQSGDLLQSVMGQENPYPRMQLETVDGQTWPVDDGSIYGYLWADADDEYMYGLYSGEIQSQQERFRAGIIHLLDHDLNLVAAYRLDHYPFTMAADQNGGIYTVTHTDTGAVFRYITFPQD